MFLLIDLILLLILIYYVITSAKRGFMRVLIEVVGFIAIGVLSFTISTPLSQVTYDKIIEPPLVESATQISAQNTEQWVEGFWESVPDFITSYAEKENVTPKSINENLGAEIESSSEQAARNISQQAVRPIAVEIISLIYSVLIMAVLSVVVVFVAKAVNKLFSFSFVGKINKILGGAAGLIKGLVFCGLFVLAVQLILTFFDNGFWIFTTENLEKTYIFKFIAGLIPFDIL